MNDPLEGLPSKQLSPKFWKKKLNHFRFLILNSNWNCFLLAMKLPTFKIFQPWVRKSLLTKMGSMTKPQWLSASPSSFQKPMWILLFKIRRNIYTVYLYVFVIYEGYMGKYKIWYVTFFQKINKNMQRKLGMKYFEHLRVWRLHGGFKTLQLHNFVRTDQNTTKLCQGFFPIKSLKLCHHQFLYFSHHRACADMS